MPIVFLGETSTPMISYSTPIEIKFRAVNQNNNPIANAPIEAVARLSYMRVTSTSHVTDANGEGRVVLVPQSSSECYDMLRVTVAGQQHTVPVVIYNPNKSPSLFVDYAIGYDGEYSIDQSYIINNGLLAQARLSAIASPADTITIIIGSFHQDRIPHQSGTSFNFMFPAAYLNQHAMTPGKYKIFYCHNTPSGNMYIPSFTLLEVYGINPVNRLLPLLINSRVPGYINITDDLYGVPMVIPGNQAGVTIGSSWKAFYSTVDPALTNSNFILLGSGTVSSMSPIDFTTVPGVFTGLNNTHAWFWYSVTNSSGISYTSYLNEVIIDTI